MGYKEYGGYIELDMQTGRELHENAIALNCGRNCLAYLFHTRNIKKIYLPYFLCESIIDVCKKYNVIIEYYHIDNHFNPIFEKNLKEREFFYLVNYYGQLSNLEVQKYKNLFKNVIVDNAQAYFQSPLENIDTLYTCRKYFGVADGAYLYSNSRIEDTLETDYSYNRMNFLLGRFEKGANEFYLEYVSNNKAFRNEPIKKMSKLTHNLLRGIDYTVVSKQRTDNFWVLYEEFATINRLDLNVPTGAFMYPLYIEHGERVREQLRRKKIYIPTLWPDVFSRCSVVDLEYDMAKNILPIPIDQRYVKEDMYYLVKAVMKCIS